MKKNVRTRLGPFAAIGALVASSAPAIEAQTMPSTLRYGSGLLDIPVASVLPHLAITGTYSGFFLDLDRTLVVDDAGVAKDFGPGRDDYFQDGSFALGLFDRLELGLSIQSLQGDSDGGNIWGPFGRLLLIKPENAGVGLAVGGRYVTAPDFDDGVTLRPNRLGFADPRLRKNFTDPAIDEVNSRATFYAVSTAQMRGFDGGFLPRHDITLTLGWGSGMFKEGDDLAFQRFADSDGVFFGSSIRVGLGENALFTFMGEYNGFDVNVGGQLDVNGVRVGLYGLALNYEQPDGGFFSEFRKPKLGIVASIAACPGTGGLCRPKLLDRPEPEVVQLPAPPPDTVRVTREVERPLPDGTPSSVCLATGEDLRVRVTAQGDTLVGPSRTPIRQLRPGVVFAGTYAEGRAWYQNDEPITFEERRYDKSGNEVRLDCARIMRVGEHQGAPLFAMRDADRPFETLYVPVRPGVWQAYQFGLRRTRG